MADQQTKKRITIEATPELHRRLKIHAYLVGESMSRVIRRLIKAELDGTVDDYEECLKA